MTRALGWLALLLAIAPSAAAQTSPRRAAPAARPPSLVSTSLRSRLGVDVAETLLRSGDSEQRQRGIERLGSVGTPQALDLLLRAFESGGAARSARDRLVAVRALSPHAGVPAVRDFLVRVMVGVGSNPDRTEAIDGLIEHAAALALARAGDDAALHALGKALRQPGHVAETASSALLAFPPRNLAPLVQGLRAPSLALVLFLDALRDPRAIPALRDITRSASNEARPAAAVALAHLGVDETVPLARHWLAHEPSAPFRLAAARILLQFSEPDAARAIAGLLAAPESRPIALTLAASARLPELSPQLLELSRNAGGDASAMFAALAATGTPSALSFLAEALSKPEASSSAALALALSPLPEAEAVLERALTRPSTRRAAVRASLVRKIALDRVPSGLRAALAALGSSGEPSDRAVFVQANAVLGDPARDTNDSELRALARTALLPERANALCRRLAEEIVVSRREALASCLVSLEAAERVPSNVLLALIEASGPSAPLAARALGARDSRALRSKILALLGSDDALLRSHAALGLGQSRDGTALGVLEGAYRFETDPDVRLDLVRGLAARSEPARKRTLDLARRLDGSEAVREAATLALAGARPARVASGRQSAWLDLVLADHGGSSAPGLRSAIVISATGLAIPAFADPDGVLLLPGLPTGPFTLRLAAPTKTLESSPQPP